jgi:uncharacterized protein YbcI
MVTTSDGQDLCVDLAQALQGFWEDYMGTRPDRICVLSDKQTIVVCLEQVLSPAEREMASTQDGCEILREFEERLLEQTKPYLQQLIRKAMGQKGILSEIHFDMASGNVLGLFQPA